MDELFRLKIAGKRQVTLPQRMLNALRLEEGDELRIEVVDGQIKLAEACKSVPTKLFNPQVLEDLNNRKREMEEGKSVRLNVRALKAQGESGISAAISPILPAKAMVKG